MSEKYGEIPKDFKGRMGYFWDYYKWHLIIGVCVVSLVAVFISQVFFRTKADYTVILGSGTPLISEQIEPLRQYMESFAEDVNGDGKVKLEIYNLSCNMNSTQASAQQMNSFISEMQLGRVMIIVTDEDFYNAVGGSDILEPRFDGLDGHGYNWYGTELQQQCEDMPENLYFCLRRVTGTSAEGNTAAEERFDAAAALLDRMIAADAAGKAEG